MKSNKQHIKEDKTSIKITEDVRMWINEIRQILRENIQKPSLTQNEVLRWICRQTVLPVTKIYQQNYWRIHDTEVQTTEPLEKKRLYETVSAMRNEELTKKQMQLINPKREEQLQNIEKMMEDLSIKKPKKETSE